MDLKIFSKKLLLFLTPILLTIGIYEYLLFDMGETYSVERVFKTQENNKWSLYMRRYVSQGFKNYKYAGILRYKPELLVAGSSRVMQFRSDFFNCDFYNAGGLVRSHKDLNELLSTALDANTILIGIDAWWFKTDNINTATDRNRFSIGESNFNITRYNALVKYDEIISDYFTKRNTKSIGANAQIENGGFRIDGSMKIPDHRVELLLKEKRFIDTETPVTSERISKGLTSRFSISKIDTSAFLHSAKLIKAFIDKGKDIIVYLPAFTSESFKTLQSTPSQREFYNFTTVYMPKVLSQLGIKFIATEHPTLYGLDDTYFIDGFHPSEVFVALQLKTHHKLFGQHIDTNTIDSLYAKRYCNILFDEVEIYRDDYKGNVVK